MRALSKLLNCMALVTAAVAPTSVAAKSEDWKTVQGWVITKDVEAESCSAVTIFKGEGQTILLIEYIPSTDSAEVNLGNKGWVSLTAGDRPTLKVDLGSEGAYDEVKTRAFVSDDYRWLGMTFAGKEFIQSFALAPWIHFLRGDVAVSRLDLTGTKFVVPELARCALSMNHGIARDPFSGSNSKGANTPSGRVSQAAGLRGNPAQFFGTDNYPPAAIRAGAQGRVVARLTVGEDGRVTECEVTGASGNEDLDTTTCRIAKSRVRFSPALDDGGKPIVSTYTLPVRWVLPEPEPEPTPVP